MPIPAFRSDTDVQLVLRRALVGGVCATLAAAALAPAVADAGITSTSNGTGPGNLIQVIQRPQGTLNSNTLESDTTAYVWFERSIQNPGSLTLGHLGAGQVDNPTPFGGNQPNPGTVTPGYAESYIVHFDQAGSTGSSSVSGVSITFDAPIIGVWYTTAGLAGSDAQWAPSGLTYGSLSARSYELGATTTTDSFLISNDLLTITILNTYTPNSNVDQLRILVNPEPGTLALMGLGLAGLGGLVLRRRRRRARASA